MKTYTLTMFYTAPVWKCIEVNAESEEDAICKAELIFKNEDITKWENTMDGDLDVEVDCVREIDQ